MWQDQNRWVPRWQCNHRRSHAYKWRSVKGLPPELASPVAAGLSAAFSSNPIDTCWSGCGGNIQSGSVRLVAIDQCVATNRRVFPAVWSESVARSWWAFFLFARNNDIFGKMVKNWRLPSIRILIKRPFAKATAWNPAKTTIRNIFCLKLASHQADGEQYRTLWTYGAEGDLYNTIDVQFNGIWFWKGCTRS